MRKFSFNELLQKCQKRNRKKKHSQSQKQIQSRKRCFLCENAIFCQKPHLFSELDYLLVYNREVFIIPKEIKLQTVELYLFTE